jgi:glycosyltransferase involved in cell wall biosynthesis
LLVSQDASRTGAPRVAIEILDALDESEWDRRVVLRWPGPLRGEFASKGAKVVTEPFCRLRVLLRKWRLTRSLANHVERFSAAFVIRWQRPDVIWCNTVLSTCYVRPGLRRGLGVVLHSHEAREWTAQILERYQLDGQDWQQTVLVGCAPRVCADLADLTGRPPKEVVYLPSVPDRNRILDLASRPGGPPPPTGVLVGACGSGTLSKGVDLWLEMVARVAPEVADLDPRFAWVGAGPPADFSEWATPELRGRVTFTGSLDNPYPWLAALDVFSFTSRVDQFPLVVLEAMNLNRAVVAFAVGDVPSQIGDAGMLVPPQDVARLADAVISLLRDPDERSRLGDAASARACEQFSVADFAADVQRIVTEARSSTGRRQGTTMHSHQNP